jgi:hypothetical protein
MREQAHRIPDLDRDIRRLSKKSATFMRVASPASTWADSR